MKRFKFAYKGEKYLGDSHEAIAFRLIKDYKDITFDEALILVKNNTRPNKDQPSTNNPIIGKTVYKTKHLSDYIIGAKALVKVVAGQVVSQEEINRRSIICSSCPRITEIPFCNTCGQAGIFASAVNKLKQLFGKGFTIPNNLEKRGCDVCDCALSVMLPSKMEYFSDKDQAQRPDNCWVKKTSVNYRE